MAIVKISKSSMFRPETIVCDVLDAVPAANATYDVPLPVGTYNMLITVNSSVTGTSTIVAISHYCNAAMSQIAAVPIRVLEADDTSAAVAITLTAGAAGRAAVLCNSASATANALTNIPVPFGLQVAVTKGGATTAELCEVKITATRIS